MILDQHIQDNRGGENSSGVRNKYSMQRRSAEAFHPEISDWLAIALESSMEPRQSELNCCSSTTGVEGGREGGIGEQNVTICT